MRMREILFRGKREDSGEWIKGLFAIHNFTGKEYYSIDRREKHIITYDDEWVYQPYEVDYCTIGQYTGLTDKNGKKIFKGDIIKICDYQIGQVVYTNGAFGIYTSSLIDWDYLDSEIETITGCDNKPYFCRNDYFCSFWELMWNYNQEGNSCDVVEVIGNIHDNPELLYGGK